MDTRISSILRVVFLIAVFPITVLSAWPQAPAEKSTIQASAREKGSSETREAERHFPSAPAEPTFKAVELRPVSTPITLAVEDDSKKIYADIGKAGGVTVLFDPDYVSRPIRVDLHRVPFREALEAVALQSRTFWRQTRFSSRPILNPSAGTLNKA